MRFKEYLKENAEEPLWTDHYKIESWLRQHDIEKWKIDQHGIVDVNDSVHLIHVDTLCIPFQFGKVSGYFDIDDNPNLTSMRGFPKYVGKYFSCQSTGITSIEYFPETVGGMINLFATPIESFVGINEKLKTLLNYGSSSGAFLADFRSVESGGLGLLLIKGIKTLRDDGEDVENLPRPFQIIESYMGKPDEIFDCQTQLIDEGFEEFAQL